MSGFFDEDMDWCDKAAVSLVFFGVSLLAAGGFIASVQGCITRQDYIQGGYEQDVKDGEVIWVKRESR